MITVQQEIKNVKYLITIIYLSSTFHTKKLLHSELVYLISRYDLTTTMKEFV